MNQLARLMGAAGTAVFIAASFVACTQTTAPSLSVSVETRRLASTVPESPQICCCRVQGIVRNTSSVPIFAELRFFAKNTDSPNGPEMVAVDWKCEIPAGGSQTYDAPGFTVPCSKVTPGSLRNDPLAFGIFSVPPANRTCR